MEMEFPVVMVGEMMLHLCGKIPLPATGTDVLGRQRGRLLDEAKEDLEQAACSDECFLCDLGAVGAAHAWRQLSSTLESTLKKMGILDGNFKGTELPRGREQVLQEGGCRRAQRQTFCERRLRRALPKDSRSQDSDTDPWQGRRTTASTHLLFTANLLPEWRGGLAGGIRSDSAMGASEGAVQHRIDEHLKKSENTS